MRRLPWDVWLTLGEIQSKCDHFAKVPLKSDLSRELHSVYLAKGVHATTAIEGNTLSEQEVRRRIDGDLILPPSREYLGREVDNIVALTNEVLGRALEVSDDRIHAQELCEFNRRILEGLATGPEVEPGKIRTHEVVVGRYSGAPAKDCRHLLDRLADWLNDPVFAPGDERRIPFGALRAILAHLYIAWIHPFGDGNGRVARMVEVKILVHAGVPSPAAHLLSNHYNSTRLDYYDQLNAASRSGGDLVPFIRYALQGLRDGLREQLDLVWEQQWTLAWRDLVHQLIPGDRRMERRRRRLVLGLTEARRPIRPSEAPALTPNLAVEYRGMNAKTILRDLAALVELGLVSSTQAGYVANRDAILAFTPSRTS